MDPSEVESLRKAVIQKKRRLEELSETVRENEEEYRQIRNELKSIEQEDTSKEVTMEKVRLRRSYEALVAELLEKTIEAKEQESTKTKQISLLSLSHLRFRVVEKQSFEDNRPAERSSIMRFTHAATVKDVIDEACSLWAIPSNQVLLGIDGCFLTETSLLIHVVDPAKFKDESSPPLLTIVRAAPREQRGEETLEGIQDTGTSVMDTGNATELKDPEEEELAHLLQQITELERESGKEGFSMESSVADTVRDLIFYTALFAMFLVGFLESTASFHRGAIFNDLTAMPFVFTAAQGGASRTETFDSIRSPPEIYTWIEKVLYNALIVQPIEVSAPENERYWLLGNGRSEVLGVIHFNQLRVRPNASCSVPQRAEQLFDACFAVYSEENQETSTYGGPGVAYTEGFEHVSENAVTNATRPVRQTEPLQGFLSSYPLPGYFVDVGAQFRHSENITDLQEEWASKVTPLQEKRWIDQSTSAILIRFNSFVGGRGLYRSQTYLFEQDLDGSFLPSSFTLDFYDSYINYSAGALAAQVILGLLVLLIMVKFAFHLRYYSVVLDDPMAFLLTIRAILDLSVIVVYFVMIGFQVHLSNEFESITEQVWIKNTVYFSFDNLALDLWNFRLVQCIFSVVVLYRLVLSFAFSSRGTVFGNTIKSTGFSILTLCFIVSLVFIAFCLVFWQLLGNSVSRFRTFWETWLTISSRLGAFVSLTRPAVQESVNRLPFYAWYTVALEFVYLFLFRFAFSAYVMVLAIHHFTRAITEFRMFTKRYEMLKEEYLAKRMAFEKRKDGASRFPLLPSFVTLPKGSCARFAIIMRQVFSVKAALKLKDPHKDFSS